MLLAEIGQLNPRHKGCPTVRQLVTLINSETH